MESYEYPFYLVDGHPFMNVSKYKAAVYWGATCVIGDTDPFIFGGETQEPFPSEGLSFHRPDYFTSQYGVYTELVFGWLLFWLSDFVIDLSRERLYVPFVCPYVGSKVLLFQDNEEFIPTVLAMIDGKEYLLQIDVGDTISLVPPEVIKDRVPVGRRKDHTFECASLAHMSDVYEIPITLSDEITINVIAKPIPERDMAAFLYTGTHGAIGVDILRNHAVTFANTADEPAMYFNTFE